MHNESEGLVESNMHLTVGETYKQAFFHSATTNPGAANIAFGDMINEMVALEITLPKNMRIGNLGDTPTSYVPEEFEVILPLGCDFRIKSHAKKFIAGKEKNAFYQINYYKVQCTPPSDYDAEIVETFSDAPIVKTAMMATGTTVAEDDTDVSPAGMSFTWIDRVAEIAKHAGGKAASAASSIIDYFIL